MKEYLRFELCDKLNELLYKKLDDESKSGGPVPIHIEKLDAEKLKLLIRDNVLYTNEQLNWKHGDVTFDELFGLPNNDLEREQVIRNFCDENNCRWSEDVARDY